MTPKLYCRLEFLMITRWIHWELLLSQTAPLPHQLCPGHPCQLLHNNPRSLTRYPFSPNVPQSAICNWNLDTTPDLSENNFNNLVESDNDSAPDSSLKISGAQSRALVPVPSMEPDALAVVPLRKCKRSDSAQHRIHRPFTVSEVEALVQAVEKLGMGRWRDVKLRAFDSAKQRTYVDLKDKWKTLVHTARISPQQRRGEPVPQELLDRVFTAHAYWLLQHLKSSSILTHMCLKIVAAGEGGISGCSL